MPDKVSKVMGYFEALNARDVPTAVQDFAANHSVRNAAFPPVSGPNAMADTIAGLYERTESVVFTPRSFAAVGDMVLADWTATLTFAEGAAINGASVHKFRLDLRGIDVFTFNMSGEIYDVQIVHETTSVARAAGANAVNGSTSAPVDAVDLVSRYLAAEESEDLVALEAMFADSVLIRNAASPPDAMPGALERFVTSFWDRTTTRSFTLHAAAFDDANAIMAYVTSVITFREGATFGPIVASKEFTVELPTALRMKLSEEGKIVELDIHHETTTAAAMAAAASA